MHPQPYKSIITNIINSHSQDTILQQVSHLHFNIQQTKQLQVKFPKQPLSLSKKMSLQTKEIGNNLFSSGDYEAAAEQYTLSLSQLQNEDPIFISKIFSNRCLCYYKLKSFQKAEADATAALREDPNNHKALRHRGMARSKISGQEDLAVSDLEQYLIVSNETNAKTDKTVTKTINKLKGNNNDNDNNNNNDNERKTSTPIGKQRVEYSSEIVGEGDIFNIWRVKFQVPTAGLQRLTGGRATVQARGGIFELIGNEMEGCVETTIETPDPKPAADEIAERIYMRINTNDEFSGMEACVVM